MNKKRAKRGRPAQTDHLKHILGRRRRIPLGRPVKPPPLSQRKKAPMAPKGMKWFRKKRKKPLRAPESAKTLTPDQARREYFTFLGRTAFYAALKRKEIPSVKIGKRLFVPRSALENFLLSCGLVTDKKELPGYARTTRRTRSR